MTLVGAPQVESPVWNPLWYYFDSTNKNLPGFRYIVDVYLKTGSSTQDLVKRLKIAPQIETGLGVTQLSKTLSTFIPGLDPNGSNIGIAERAFIRYNLEIGEEYPADFTYNQPVIYNPGPAVKWNGYTLLGLGTPHTFVPGDLVTIVGAVGSAPAIQGIHTVVAVPDPTQIVINVPFIQVQNFLVGGTVTYSDGQRSQFLNLLTVSDRGAWGGAIEHNLWPSYTTSSITPSGDGIAPFLTTIPQGFRVSDDSLITLYLWGSGVVSWIYFENNLGVIRRAALTGGAGDYLFSGVGPANLPSTTLVQSTNGNDNLIQEATRWYDVWAADAGGNRITRKQRFNYRSLCSRWGIKTLAFRDRLGSLSSFNFEYSARERVAMDREIIKTSIGGQGSSGYTYQKGESSSRVISSRAEESLELVTAWLTDDESKHFTELLSSTQVWISDGGHWLPVVVREEEVERKRIGNENNLRYTVRVTLGNDNIVQA